MVLTMSTQQYKLTQSEYNTHIYSKRATRTHLVYTVQLAAIDWYNTVSSIESVHTAPPILSDCICRNTDTGQAG